jgi:hypothetical protein
MRGGCCGASWQVRGCGNACARRAADALACLRCLTHGIYLCHTGNPRKTLLACVRPSHVALAGLAYIHSQGLIHRDLKPAVRPRKASHDAFVMHGRKRSRAQPRGVTCSPRQERRLVTPQTRVSYIRVIDKAQPCVPPAVWSRLPPMRPTPSIKRQNASARHRCATCVNRSRAEHLLRRHGRNQAWRFWTGQDLHTWKRWRGGSCAGRSWWWKVRCGYAWMALCCA